MDDRPLIKVGMLVEATCACCAGLRGIVLNVKEGGEYVSTKITKYAANFMDVKLGEETDAFDKYTLRPVINQPVNLSKEDVL